MPIGYFVQVMYQKNVRRKLRSSNTSNISLQLVAQHCCFESCKALLTVLPPPQATCRTTNFSVASCSNMLHEVELGSTFGNKF